MTETNLAQVEEYLRDVNSMAVEFVEVAEKACEKERRKLQREEKVEEQRLERESRLKLAMERANVRAGHTSASCRAILQTKHELHFSEYSPARELPLLACQAVATSQNPFHCPVAC